MSSANNRPQLFLSSPSTLGCTNMKGSFRKDSLNATPSKLLPLLRPSDLKLSKTSSVDNPGSREYVESLTHRPKTQMVSSTSRGSRRPFENQLSGSEKLEYETSHAEHRRTASQGLAYVKLHRIEKKDCEVKGKVGEGSFGLVLLATWVPMQKTVILKVLKPRKSFEERLAGSDVTYEDLVRAFRREIRIMQDCGEHPNIVPLLGKGANDTMLVMSAATMDLYKLCKKVKTGNSLLPVHLIEKWGREILSAVSHIHARGIVHQDIKSNNILIFKDGSAKICDFGLASRMTDDLTIDRQICTLWYRPPEVLMGCQSYTRLVDEWGAGCIILEMLIGEVPLQGDTSDSNYCSCKQPSHINYNADQLQKIFHLIGSPQENEVSNLTCWDHFRTWPHQEASLASVVHNACHQRVETGVNAIAPHEFDATVASWTSALAHLLTHTPETRFSADQALALPVFHKTERWAQTFFLGSQCPSFASPTRADSNASAQSRASLLQFPCGSSSPGRTPTTLLPTALDDASTLRRRSSSASKASTASGRSARGSLDAGSGGLHQARKATSEPVFRWPNVAEPRFRTPSRVMKSRRSWDASDLKR